MEMNKIHNCQNARFAKLPLLAIVYLLTASEFIGVVSNARNAK
jgi:hypothetical protein